ncbi:hypothetical protein HHK36_000515 [Tetracentron sinense]|uniref:Uncharacterized protein n=1 Tax=Tetracentron sinense TaxID=13715 RepID=A0A835DU32_TETSI|nr:hypothetical protein HHK36_000494 [Tetracentron sinense]KAF8412547.1 hypothetical protein HHK36_000515 [Tetracentron sinense]
MRNLVQIHQDQVLRNRFMDIKAPGEEVSQQLTRESLIAISQFVPDKILDLELLTENLSSTDVVQVIDSDGDKKYRSKLISISYMQSPDIKTLPPTLENLEG